MHPCPALLEEAFVCLASEASALDAEDLDKADELAAARAALIDAAWKARGGFDEQNLRQRLHELADRHRHLATRADSLWRSLRERQSASRKQSRYLNTERQINALAKKSLYCDKRS
jgi:uncharacterized protein (DUF3084 family)